MLKLGAQLYTIRDYVKTEQNYKQSIRRLSEFGYKYIQISGIGPIAPEFIAEVSKQTGVKILLTHTSPARILNETEKVIQEHDLYGCDAIGVGGMGEGYPVGEGESYIKFAADFKKAIQKIKDSGKIFLYHNHSGELQKFENYGNKNGLELLMENTDKDAFKLTLDSYWLHAAGWDIVQFVEKYHERIHCTHLKDMAVLDNKIIMKEILDGNINFDGFLKVCQKYAIDQHFVELDTTQIDPMDALKISYDNLMKTGLFE